MKFRWSIFLILAAIFSNELALAGWFEYNFGFSYSRRNYQDAGYGMSRIFSTGLSYNFLEVSGVEIGYQDILERTKVEGQNIQTRDQIYSINWIQHILPRRFPVLPYVKLGFGQINKVITDMDTKDRLLIDWITVLLAAGVKVKILQRIAINVSVASYLEEAKIETYKDNIFFQAGFSIYF